MIGAANDDAKISCACMFTHSPFVCNWSDVKAYVDELVVTSRYFDGGEMFYLVASGGNLEELKACILEVTSWPVCQIKTHLFQHAGRQIIIDVDK